VRLTANYWWDDLSMLVWLAIAAAVIVSVCDRLGGDVLIPPASSSDRQKPLVAARFGDRVTSPNSATRMSAFVFTFKNLNRWKASVRFLHVGCFP
jgi:hypothetical protein